MTVMPSFCHCGINLSRSIILVVARYSTGVRVDVAAISFRRAIGERRVLPDANHVSSSAIQKSESLWVAIACVSVMTMSPSVSNVRLWFAMCNITAVVSALYSVTGGVDSGVGAGVGSSKFMSWNTGVNWVDMSSKFGVSMSKSDGNGTLLGSMSVVVLGAVGAADAMSLADVGTTTGVAGVGGVIIGTVCIFFWVRINASCISGGMSSGIFISGAVAGVSGSAGLGAGVGAVAGLNTDAMRGVGIVINGFLLRTINVVVAMYNGNAANINMPKTKPPKPCSSACINLCQRDASNISKLNINNNIAHITKI